MGKASIGLFAATPYALPASGGKVRLLAVVQSATTCRFFSPGRLKGLPAAKSCSSGQVSVTVRLSRNTTSSKRVFRFQLTASGTAGTTTAAPVTVTQDAAPKHRSAPSNAPPLITTQPSSESVVSGTGATFTAAASGTPAPTVQWQLSTDGGGSWADVSGATSATYALSAGTGQSGYEYRAVFTNAAGVATTNPATLTVAAATVAAANAAAATAGPAVTLQPSSHTVISGAVATFTSAASGAPAPGVQWQVSTDGGTSWANLAGANSMSYSFTASLGQSGYKYRAVFTNVAGSATSDPAALTVPTSNSAPAITIQPASQSVFSGSGVTFTAAASGNPTPTVQWQRSTDGGGSWAPITGETATSYSFTAGLAQNGYEYRAVFTNVAGSATTTPATLTVSAIGPGVTLQPASQAVLSGTFVTFTAAASGTPAPTVQWWQSSNGGLTWVAIGGATATSYSFTAAAGQNGYEYRALFSNIAGSVTTSAARLSVSVPNSAPTITIQPFSQTVAAGGSVAFNAAASGTPAPSVQWQLSTDGGANWGNVSGGSSPSYSFAAVSSENGYKYRAVFTNVLGNATTNPATLTVTLTTPTSSNWSGYSATGETFTAVTGTWTVPTVSCSSSSTYSSQWVGIDGDGSGTVEQDGTETDCVGGVATYNAWYEMYGDRSVSGGNEVPLSSVTYPVLPGDVMTASVTVSGSSWTLGLHDASQGWTSSTNIVWSGPAKASAEWIVERPTVNGSISSLANFGSVTFTGSTADGNGQTGGISTFSTSAYDMVSGSTVLAHPGPLNSSGDGFTDNWVS